jgi:hypothetical protein
MWANELRSTDRERALELLKLPATAGPSKWFMTEFEDPWPYRAAPADLYFARAAAQETVKRPPIIEYTTADQHADWVLASVVVGPILARVRRRRRGG